MDNTTPKTCTEILQPLLADRQVDGEVFESLVGLVAKSKNELQQKMTLETFKFDNDWINQIDSTLFSIEKISKSPKSGIIEDRLVVPVEKSKKINAETVRHLSSHTNNIRGFDEKGTVKPSKVLNVLLEEDLLVYENRFVYSLIKKLIHFIDTRIKIIRDKIDVYTTSQIFHNTQFKLKKSDITYNLQIKVKSKNDSGEDFERNKALLDQIENLKKRLSILDQTEFCKKLAKGKLVNAPIMKTNTLKMNVDYRNCYNLWIYISGYTELGFFIDVTDKAVSVDTEYFDDLTLLTALSVKAMIENDLIRDEIRKKIPFDDKSRRLKVVDKIVYDADADSKEFLEKESLINQFYFDKVKDLIKKHANKNVLVKEHKIAPDFAKFYKALTDINTKMFFDVLKLYDQEETGEVVVKKTELAQKKDAIKKQKETVAKHKKMTRLMMTTVNQQLARENKEVEKLKKAETALEKLLAQQERQREKTAKEKAELLAKKEAAKNVRAAEIAAKKAQEKAEQAAAVASETVSEADKLKAMRAKVMAEEKAILAKKLKQIVKE